MVFHSVHISMNLQMAVTALHHTASAVVLFRILSQIAQPWLVLAKHPRNPCGGTCWALTTPRSLTPWPLWLDGCVRSNGLDRATQCLTQAYREALWLPVAHDPTNFGGQTWPPAVILAAAPCWKVHQKSQKKKERPEVMKDFYFNHQDDFYWNLCS